MGSYVDVHQRYRRSRYHAPATPRRRAVRIKAGRVLLVTGLLWVVMIRAAYGGGRSGTEQVTVQPNQTLWSIAAERYPDDDIRARVAEIVDLNHLGGAAIFPGEKLTVPAR
jgi:nucleoid-associated protein YgaU